MNRIYKGDSLTCFVKDYVVFDIETTGLDSVHNEIIEIGAIKVVDNEITDTFQSFIKPKYRISSFITNLTGISNDMVKDALDVREVLMLFKEFVGDDILIGHNVNFDINFVYDHLILNNLYPLDNNYIDTLRLSRKYNKKLSHHRLSDLATIYHIDNNNAHRALNDAYTTYYVYKHMYDLYATKPRKLKVLDNIFENKCFTISGRLHKYTKEEIETMILENNGIIDEDITISTNYLIVGSNGNNSTKMIIAKELIRLGYNIQIITEEELNKKISL